MATLGSGASVEHRESILEPIVRFGIALTILMVIAGFGFIVAMVKWLLAIRKRRRVQAASGFLPRENR
jgi:hypothetical protein